MSTQPERIHPIDQTIDYWQQCYATPLTKLESPPIPDFLRARPPPPERTIPKSKEARSLEDMLFDAILEPTLERIAMGHTLKSILAEDARDFDPQRFTRWLHRSPARQAMYHEAQAMGAYALEQTIVEKINGDSIMVDVPLETLKFNQLKWLLGIYNRKRYGDVKQIDVSGTISVRKALDMANARVIHGSAVREDDIEDAEVLD